ncbi:hypothetical protein ACI2K4_17635 [Micromonospora sp. NPDC050397]|uniref:hypothetical protein n=1 Tax=Micromonospora sp. NPDC050397 TaxID=3364279 RepID=UPI00384E78C1
MKIDDRVEALVREALDAAVKQDQRRFEAGLVRVAEAGLSGKALELLVAITAFIVLDIHSGKPSGGQLTDLANSVSDQEAWVDLAQSEVHAYLGAVVRTEPMAKVLSPQALVVVPYLTAANLLTTVSKPDQGEWWFNYLDKVEAVIERSTAFT